MLNEYITLGRYPSDLPFEDISEDETRKAIEAAEKIEKHVLKNIKFTPDIEKDIQQDKKQ